MRSIRPVTRLVWGSGPHGADRQSAPSLKHGLGLLGVLAVAAAATVSFARGGRALAGEGWADTRVAGPFVCRADFRLDGMEPLLTELSGLQNDLVQWLHIPPASEYIELYLFHSEWTYRRYLGRHLPQVPYRRALYLKSGGPGMVLAFRSHNLEVDLRHECTHALLHAALPLVPLWLDEGLAEYFELPRDQRAYDNSYLFLVRWNARLGIVPDLKNLGNKGDLSEMGGSEYRSAWAWVHFCLHGSPEAHDELVRFFDDIAHNAPPGQIGDRLASRIPDLGRRFASHFVAWTRRE